MSTSQTEPLLRLLDGIVAARTSANALFALAASGARLPEEALVLRSIARTHQVRVLLLEAQLAALDDGPDRLTVESY